MRGCPRRGGGAAGTRRDRSPRPLGPWVPPAAALGLQGRGPAFLELPPLLRPRPSGLGLRLGPSLALAAAADPARRPRAAAGLTHNVPFAGREGGGGGGRGARRGLGAGARCPGDGRPYKGMGGRARRPAPRPAGGTRAERGTAWPDPPPSLPPLLSPPLSSPGSSLNPCPAAAGSWAAAALCPSAASPTYLSKALPSTSGLGRCVLYRLRGAPGTSPIPGRSNNGSPVAPGRGRGACLCATYTRARARPHTLGHCFAQLQDGLCLLPLPESRRVRPPPTLVFAWANTWCS